LQSALIACTEVLVLWCSVKLEPLLQDFMSQKHPLHS
jgi:hypothetical protein